MTKLLKYLIIFIFAGAFINGIDKADSVIILNNSIQEMNTEIEAYYSDHSTSDFEIYLPRRVSSTNVFRVQNTPKRSNTTHRHNFEFIKFGKVFSLGISNFIQKKPQIIHFSFTNPIHRLISFGKLVI